MNAHYNNWYNLCFYSCSRSGTEIFHCKGSLTNTVKPLATSAALSWRVNNPGSSGFGFPPCRLPGHTAAPVPVTTSSRPCTELLLSLLTGKVRKQGPLTQAGLSPRGRGTLRGVCSVLLPVDAQARSTALCPAEGLLSNKPTPAAAARGQWAHCH